MGRNGFTFPELAVVLAIVVFHAALLIPTLADMREEARRSLCARNLGVIGGALRRYEDDRGAMPNADTGSGSFRLLLEGDYLPDPDTLSCPSNPLEVDLDGGPEGTGYYVDSYTPPRRHPLRALAADRNLYGDWTENHGDDGFWRGRVVRRRWGRRGRWQRRPGGWCECGEHR